MIGNEYRDLVMKRTGLKKEELECPREQSAVTPCVARDGDLAMTDDGKCAGCGHSVLDLVIKEREKT